MRITSLAPALFITLFTVSSLLTQAQIKQPNGPSFRIDSELNKHTKPLNEAPAPELQIQQKHSTSKNKSEEPKLLSLKSNPTNSNQSGIYLQLLKELKSDEAQHALKNLLTVYAKEITAVNNKIVEYDRIINLAEIKLKEEIITQSIIPQRARLKQEKIREAKKELNELKLLINSEKSILKRIL